MKTIGGVDIKEHTFKFDDGDEQTIPYVSFSEIPEEYKKEFNEWSRGSTCPVIPGCDDAVYSWDWERFFNRKTRGIPTMWD
jgi:hypothetical protein